MGLLTQDPARFYVRYAQRISVTKIRDYAAVFQDSGTDANNPENTDGWQVCHTNQPLANAYLE